MGKQSIWQCQRCGNLKKTKENIDITDDLYTEMKCPKCRGDTPHLFCGNDEIDISYYYNLNIDPRYY